MEDFIGKVWRPDDVITASELNIIESYLDEYINTLGYTPLVIELPFCYVNDNDNTYYYETTIDGGLSMEDFIGSIIILEGYSCIATTKIELSKTGYLINQFIRYDDATNKIYCNISR